MSRKKEHWRDSATHAFIKYAHLGCPTVEEREKQIRQECYNKFALSNPSFISIKADDAVAKKVGELKDIEAVNRVLDILQKQDKQHIIDALRAVYFYDPHGKPDRCEIVNRVIRFAYEYPSHERSVYRWLKSARLLFAKLRELDTDEFDGW